MHLPRWRRRDSRRIDRADEAKGCVFFLSDLRRARFANCDLSFATFERSDLFPIDMENCNLLGARFAKSEFSHAATRKTVTTRARFHDCNLNLAYLAGLHLAGCELSKCRLREANLDSTDLTGADLRDSDMFQATLDNAKLDRADLRGADITGLNLLRLASFAQLKINGDQQHHLLLSLGIDIDG